MRLLYIRLPLTVTCDQCILQWTYVGGNNWGTCQNGTSGLGCGPQEHFRSCADIRIVPHPLLSPDQKLDFTDEHFLADSAENLSIGFFNSDGKKDYISFEEELPENKVSLERKRELLEQVLLKLQELIMSTDKIEKDRFSTMYSNDVEDLRAEASNRRIFAPEPDWNNPIYDDDSEDTADSDGRWWNKILSNRH